jgi:serine/threonine protein kinase
LGVVLANTTVTKQQTTRQDMEDSNKRGRDEVSEQAERSVKGKHGLVDDGPQTSLPTPVHAGDRATSAANEGNTNGIGRSIVSDHVTMSDDLNAMKTVPGGREVISQGAFSKIFTDKNDTSRVVKQFRLSTLKKSEVTAEQLDAQYSVLIKLAHCNVVRHYAPRFRVDHFRFEMTYLDGQQSLLQRITCEPAPTEAEIIHWTRQMASALSYCHQKSVVHCNLKPENILLTNSADSTIKIVGFEPACTLAAKIKSSDGVRASVYYDLQGRRCEGRDDVWAVGCMVLELLIRARYAIYI